MVFGEEESIALCAALLCTIMLRRRLRSKRRATWSRKWLGRRRQRSSYSNIIRELRIEDADEYMKYLRMTSETFASLLDKVRPYIEKQPTVMRMPISAAERLTVTLRFLATGETYTSLQYQFRIHKTTLSKIIPETCEAIYLSLKDEYLQTPKTEKEWLSIAAEFKEKWNFDHCIGAIDGKHVMIKPPADTGSFYYNYKHTFSVVLMAVVDADYKFRYVDVGCNGRISDGGVFKNCSLASALETDLLNIPKATPLPGMSNPCPYVIVADDAFPLKTYIMKLFNLKEMELEKRIFNYRLSRARRIVENAFGILSNRFMIFKSSIALCPEKVEVLILASVCLHNMLRSLQGGQYIPPGSVDYEDTSNEEIHLGEWRNSISSNGLRSITQQGGNRYTLDAKAVREEFSEYFNSSGSVEWQWGMI